MGPARRGRRRSTARKKKSNGQDANLSWRDMIPRAGPGNERQHGPSGVTQANRRVSIAGRWSTAVGVILLAAYARDLQGDQRIGFSLWSGKRAVAYGENLLTQKGSLLAVLRFERLNLRVPIFEGTDNWTLNRDAGWIAGTTRPGEGGRCRDCGAPR